MNQQSIGLIDEDGENDQQFTTIFMSSGEKASPMKEEGDVLMAFDDEEYLEDEEADNQALVRVKGFAFTGAEDEDHNIVTFDQHN